LAIVAKEVIRAVDLPVGINVLRNDWKGALAIAAATGARFIRLNVLTDADGAVFGTWAKRDNVITNPVDADNVRRLVTLSHASVAG